MSSNVPINSPFLRTSRDFPPEINQIAIEAHKAYIDTANCVNARTVSIFPSTRSVVTGEAWYIFQNRKQGGFRQVYTFTAAGNIPHGINLNLISGFVRIFGTFTDGSIWYPLPWVDIVAATNQINVKVDSDNIIIAAGAGAPVITSGRVVLEWLGNI